MKVIRQEGVKEPIGLKIAGRAPTKKLIGLKITLKTSDKREVQIRSQKLVIYNVRLYVYGSVQQNMSTSFILPLVDPPRLLDL